MRRIDMKHRAAVRADRPKAARRPVGTGRGPTDRPDPRPRGAGLPSHPRPHAGIRGPPRTPLPRLTSTRTSLASRTSEESPCVFAAPVA